MHKKGFTLIELLAVIVILAIVLAIAVPSISKLIDNVRLQAFIDNEEMLVRATKKMVGIDESYLPKTIGETMEITLSELQTNKYIGTIISPNNKNQECNGYILVTKIDNDKYEYTPHLNCGSDIGSSSDDGLELHYKFDDFQEPTINLITNGNMQNNMTNWIDNQTISKSLITRNEKTYLKIVSGQSSSTPGIRYADIPVSSETDYTYSLNLKSLKNNIILWVTNASNTQLAIKNNLLANQEDDVRVSISFNSGVNTSIRVWVLFSGTLTGDWFEMTDVQLEKKPYPTPYVNGERTDEVKDYSGNNRHTALQLSSTPKWTADSKVGKGAYKFDGLDDYIKLPNEIVSVSKIRVDGVSYSAWVKLNSIGYQRIVGQQTAIGYSDYSSGGIGISSNGKAQMIAYSDSNPANYIRIDGTTTLEKDRWYYIVGSFNPLDSKLRIYVNGKLEGVSETLGVFSRLYTNTSNRIGNKEHSTSLPFNGIVDDIYVYSRVLNDDEINLNYQTIQIREK